MIIRAIYLLGRTRFAKYTFRKHY